MALTVLLRRKELALRRHMLCGTLCELLVPALLVGGLLIGEAFATVTKGAAASYAPNSTAAALGTLSPLTFGQAAFGLGGAALGGGGGELSGEAAVLDALSNFSTGVPTQGGAVYPLELYLVYNHVLNAVTGGLGGVLGSLAGLTGAVLIPSEVSAACTGRVLSSAGGGAPASCGDRSPHRPSVRAGGRRRAGQQHSRLCAHQQHLRRLQAPPPNIRPTGLLPGTSCLVHGHVQHAQHVPYMHMSCQ